MRPLHSLRLLVYPRRCPFCGRVLGRVLICPDCAPDLEELRRKPGMRLDPAKHYLGHLQGAAATYRYEGKVRGAILRAKYNGAPWVADELGLELSRLLFGSEIKLCGMEPRPASVDGGALAYDCIVPVPASSRARGYNVPQRLAKPLAEALGVPLLPHALRRTRRKKRQAGLSLDERMANVAGAFAADPGQVEGKRVLLVDDVITTGATAAACTQALLAAGAESVFAAALATVEFDAPPKREMSIDESAVDGEKELEKI